MSKKGYICMPQQTWKTFGNSTILDNIYIIPNFGNMSFKEIKSMADMLHITFRE